MSGSNGIPVSDYSTCKVTAHTPAQGKDVERKVGQTQVSQSNGMKQPNNPLILAKVCQAVCGN